MHFIAILKNIIMVDFWPVWPNMGKHFKKDRVNESFNVLTFVLIAKLLCVNIPCSLSVKSYVKQTLNRNHVPHMLHQFVPVRPVRSGSLALIICSAVDLYNLAILFVTPNKYANKREWGVTCFISRSLSMTCTVRDPVRILLGEHREKSKYICYCSKQWHFGPFPITAPKCVIPLI